MSKRKPALKSYSWRWLSVPQTEVPLCSLQEREHGVRDHRESQAKRLRCETRELASP